MRVLRCMPGVANVWAQSGMDRWDLVLELTEEVMETQCKHGGVCVAVAP